MATNKEIVKATVAQMGAEGQAKFAEIDIANGAEVFSIMEQYPTIKNEFVETLTNKVVQSLVYSKIFENPLKMLKQPMLNYGDSIEELFVEMAQIKGFLGHWLDGAGANTEEADLIRALEPKITALYISKNVDYKGKATIFDKQLRKAFFNEGGLSNIVNQIVGSITSGMEYKEFETTKKLLTSFISEGKQISKINDDGTIALTPINNGGNLPIKQTPYCVSVAGATESEKMKNLVQQIRTEVGNMKFPSDKYNLAKKITWSNPDELMLFTTADVSASLDVNVLANAFNVSSTDIQTRTILLDEMPKGIFKAGNNALVDKIPTTIDGNNVPTLDGTKKVLAVLISKDLLQIRDTYNGAGTFFNPHKGYTNHFANREGIFSTCLFENMVIFYE